MLSAIARVTLAGALLVALAVSPASGGPGDADAGFGTAGRLTTVINGATSRGHRMLLQDDDGKIVVVGTAGGGFAVARYLDTGAPDLTFGEGGFVHTTFGSAPEAWGILRQPDDKYVVCGHDGSIVVLQRYTALGAPDGAVSIPFTVPVAAYSIARRPSDGGFIVAGYASNAQSQVVLALLRFTSIGSLDMTYGSAGVSASPFRGLAGPIDMVMLPDESVVVTTTRNAATENVFGLAHFSAEGVLDAQFGTAGVATAPVPFGNTLGIARQTDGKLIAVGQSGGGLRAGFGIARFTATGAVDSDFGTGGVVVTSFADYEDLHARAEDACVQADGKILVTGELFTTANGSEHFALARYLSDGRLDETFGACGRLVVDWGGRSGAEACGIDGQGRLVVAGHANIRSVPDFAVTRFDLSGTRDTTACNAGPIEDDLEGTLPTEAAAASRKEKKVARSLGKLFVKALKAGNKADTQTGRARTRSIKKARGALSKMLKVARKADGKGTLGAPFPPIETALNEVIAKLDALP